MSSFGQNTTASSVPPNSTPSFFRRLTSAYSAALDALMSPTSPRPDPSEVDPGPQPNRPRPPLVIDVETVYSADASQPTYNEPSVHTSPDHTNAPIVSSHNSSARSTSPISLFPSTSRPPLSGPSPVVPLADAFSPAFPRDPGMSPINPSATFAKPTLVEPSFTSHEKPNPAVCEPTSHDPALPEDIESLIREPTSHDIAPTNSAVFQFLRSPSVSRATSPTSRQNLVSLSQQNLVSPSPPTNPSFLPSNHGTNAAAAVPHATVQPSSATSASPSAVNVSIHGPSLASNLHDAAPPGFFSPLAPPPSTVTPPSLCHDGAPIVPTVSPSAASPPSLAINHPSAFGYTPALPIQPISSSHALAPSPSIQSTNTHLPSTAVTHQSAHAAPWYPSTAHPATTQHGPAAPAPAHPQAHVAWQPFAAPPASTAAPTFSASRPNPSHMPTPWSHAARAAATPQATFSSHCPSTVYTPHPFGLPGFQAVCAPSPAPTMISPGLDIVTSPRSPLNGMLTRQARVSKHERGTDAVDVEKLINIATAALPSEYALRYISSSGIADPTEYSPKIADYYTNYSLTIDAIMDRLIEFDMLATVEMYEHFDLETAAYGGQVINLLKESHLVPLPRVLDWQYYCRLHLSPADQLSDNMVSKLVLKSLHHSVRQDVMYDLAELPEHQRGGATTIKVAMDKLSANSFEIRLCIQRGLTSFVITAYPKEDVTLATQHVKTLARIALQQHDLPPRVVIYVLKGMAKSLSESFNSLCEQFVVREEMDYSPPAPGVNVQKRDFDQLLQVTGKLAQFHRNAIQSGTWPAALKSSSSLVVAKPSAELPADSVHGPDVESIVAALVSRLSPGGPRSPTRRPLYQPSTQFPCSNCGSSEHWHRECPHPRTTPRPDSRARSSSHQRPRSTSRTRSDSRPRDASRPSSRSNSRDNARGRPIFRTQTPGRPREGSRDRTVAFDAQAHNVTATSPAPTAADLLRTINGHSSN